MAYQAEISRSNPTCFIFLVDQSSSMADPIMGVPGNSRKAEFVADALNKILQTLVVTASRDVEVRRYFQIGAIGYGSEVNFLFQGNLFGKDLVWIDEVYQNPIRIEERLKKEYDGAGGVIEVKTKFPIWIDPIANGQTHMCGALDKARQILEVWTAEHPYSFPPTVINLTDGEANDGDPLPIAEAIKKLSTQDGNVILMSLHTSSNENFQQSFFPNTIEGLPDEPSRKMFDMSSPLTDGMRNVAEQLHQVSLPSGSKGFVYNGDILAIIQALEIGTRPSNLR